MAEIKSQYRDYLMPALNAIEGGIDVLKRRIDNRAVVEWRETEFALVAATAQKLADDCIYIVHALETLRDVEEDRV